MSTDAEAVLDAIDEKACIWEEFETRISVEENRNSHGLPVLAIDRTNFFSAKADALIECIRDAASVDELNILLIKLCNPPPEIEWMDQLDETDW